MRPIGGVACKPFLILTLLFGLLLLWTLLTKVDRPLHANIVKEESSSHTSSTRTISSFITRDCLTGEIIKEWTGNYTVKEGISLVQNIPLETDSERAKVFQKIFDERIYINRGTPIAKGYEDVQSSGTSSTVRHTQTTMAILAATIDHVKRALGKATISMLDVPCGDMLWMSQFLSNRTDVRYVGVDIVRDIIAKHNKRYGNVTNWTFYQHDIVRSPLSGHYDLVFSRHMTMNLQIAETINTLRHASSMGEFLLLSDYPMTWKNRPLDLKPRHRFIDHNFSLEPFRITPPLCIGREAMSTWLALYKLPLYQFHNCTPGNNRIPYMKYHLIVCQE